MNGQQLPRQRRVQRLQEYARDSAGGIVWPLLDGLQQNPEGVRFKHSLQIEDS